MVGSPGIPAAVRERPPRNGPIDRYFIPLKSGSPSFFSSFSLSSFAEGSEAMGAFFWVASTLRFPSFCWENVSVTENRTKKASTRSLWIRIMNLMAPEKEFAMGNVNAGSAKGTNGRPCGDASRIHSPPRTLRFTKEKSPLPFQGTYPRSQYNEHETLVDFCCCR